MSVNLPDDTDNEINLKDIQVLKSCLIRMKSVEEQALDLISRLEKK